MKSLSKSKILLAGMVFCGITTSGMELPDLPDREGFDLKGYVHDGTCGVAGVLVTDGYSFARTDENGAYYLASSPDAEFVYMVLPSGYEHAVVETGVVKYFSVIDRSNGAFRADFALNPIGDDNSFSFMVHADTQPDEYFNSEVYTELGKAYKDMVATASKLQQSDGFSPFNLHLGDIVYNTNDKVRDYTAYLSVLHTAGYNIPIFATPGNHDRRYQTDLSVSTKAYREVWGPLYHSFNRGKVHFISLDNVLIKKDGDYTKGIRAEQVEWLKKDLSYVEKGSKVVFFTHQPMSRNKSALTAYSGVLDILKDYDVMILTGHLHRAFNNFPEYAPTIKERNQTALGGYEWRSTCSQDGVPNGYYIYNVDGTEISWKFKPIGKDADKNMFRMYEPGFPDTDMVKPSDDKTVIVNIWDWDTNWKVTWSLDGVEQGDVARYEAAKDPLAVYQYENVPGHDTWSASETYHLFHCDVPSTGSVVKVTVTDPFGRTLSKTLELASVPGGIEAIAPESCGVERVEIYNVHGVKVLTVEGYPETDTLPLGPGCYVMRLMHYDGRISIEKFVR